MQAVTYIFPLRYYFVIIRGLFLKGVSLPNMADIRKQTTGSKMGDALSERLIVLSIKGRSFNKTNDFLTAFSLVIN